MSLDSRLKRLVEIVKPARAFLLTLDQFIMVMLRGPHPDGDQPTVYDEFYLCDVTDQQYEQAITAADKYRKSNLDPDVFAQAMGYPDAANMVASIMKKQVIQ